MKKNNVLRSLQSFALFPILTANLIMPIGIHKLPTAAVLSTPEIRPLLADASDNKQKVHDEEVAKMKAYFADKNLPMAEHAEELVTEAEKNGLDWSILGGISMIESTGGKFGRNNNYFGWGSANIRFDSIDESIRVVAENLGGNDPDTAKWYKGKDTKGILETYNPPRIVKTYAQQVQAVMQTIKDYPLPDGSTLAMNS